MTVETTPNTVVAAKESGGTEGAVVEAEAVEAVEAEEAGKTEVLLARSRRSSFASNLMTTAAVPQLKPVSLSYLCPCLSSFSYFR